jgi:hypothetical protein
MIMIHQDSLQWDFYAVISKNEIKNTYAIFIYFLPPVSLNFFGDKHGKNGRDAHFSNLARFINMESLVRQLASSKDICDAINKRQQLANENKILNFISHRGRVCF